MYRKLIARQTSRGALPSHKIENRKLLAADSAPMKVIASFDAEVKANGLMMPFTFLVIESLTHDCILGMDFLTFTKANIDIGGSVLTLFEGMTSLPLTRQGSVSIVETVANVSIPACSEAAIAVRSKRILPAGNYMIESSIYAPCRALLVARTLVDANRRTVFCRVMNPTEKVIRLKVGTTIGEISPVTINAVNIDESSANIAATEQLPSVAEMRKVLEQKTVNLQGTAFQGKDLDDLITMLYKNRDIMATSLKDLPGCDVLLFRIDTGNHPPIRQRAYRHSPAEKLEIDRQIKEMIDADIIEPTDSPWASPVLLVRKKDSSSRLVIDFRRLNSVTAMTSWPLPTLEDCIDLLSQGSDPEHGRTPGQKLYLCGLDLRSGYNQVLLDPESRDKTAFATHRGNFAFKRLAFGLSGSPPYFQMLMEKVLRGLPPLSVLIYLDDCLIIARSPSEMMQRLQQVFDCFRKANLRIHPAKCQFGVTRIHFLGHVFDERGMAADEAKISIVKNYPVPRTPKQVKSFIGLCSYYRRFVENFSKITAPLRLLLKQNAKFVWTDECQKAFEELKQRLISAPILSLPDFSRPFYLTTDASQFAISYILSQKDEQGRESVIAYAGRGLRGPELRYAVTEKECLAIVEGVRHFHTYLASNPFFVVTDHRANTYLNTMKLSGNSRLARWTLALQPYRFTLIYKKGESLTSADCLSRLQYDTKAVDNESPAAEGVVKQGEPTSGNGQLDFDFADGITDNDGVIAPVDEIDSLLIPSIDDLKRAQAVCADFAGMYAYLLNGSLPNDDKMARRIVIESQDYILHDGTLFHLYSPRTKRLHRAYMFIRQLCIPAQFRERVIKELHDRLAHAGFDRVYAALRVRFWWPGQYVFLKNYIRTCVECQQNKRQFHPNTNPILNLEVPLPLQRIHLDFHGPLVPSNGFTNILVLIDATSFWCELIPVTNCDAKTTMQALYDHFICRFGLPENFTIMSDNGAAFTSELMRLFCEKFRIKQSFIAPYNKKANSRAEQVAATIHQSLRMLCAKHSDWSVHLQTVAMALRCLPSCSSLLSPYEIIFGRRMITPIDLNLMVEQPTIDSSDMYARFIRPKLQVLYEIASGNARDSALRHSLIKNKEASPPKFQKGDKVLISNPVTKPGESAKLTQKYLGPFVIEEVHQGFNYILRDLVTGQQLRRRVHADRLRPFFERDSSMSNANETHVCLYEGKTLQRQLSVQVVVGDVAKMDCDVLVNPTNGRLNLRSDISAVIMRTAGEAARQECQQFLLNHRKLQDTQVLFTTAGALQPRVKAICHIVSPKLQSDSPNFDVLAADKSLCDSYLRCFKEIDSRAELASVAMPLLGSGSHGLDSWTISHAAIKALVQYDNETLPGSLRRIVFVVLSLADADVLTVVCKKLLDLQPPSSDDVIQIPQQQESFDATGNEDEWYSITGILKQQKRKGKLFYLVRWEQTGETQWLPAAQVSDFAIQQFKDSRKTAGSSRRRRCRRSS